MSVETTRPKPNAPASGPTGAVDAAAAAISDDRLNRAFFQVLARVLECGPAVPDTDDRIFPWEIEWRERKAPRAGYLSLGAPGERSAALPPRAFTIYVLEPFATPSFRDTNRQDEVFLHLTGLNEVFAAPLRRFAAADEMVADALGPAPQLSSETETALRQMSDWLEETIQSATEVTYQGKPRRLQEWIRGKVYVPRGSRAGVRDFICTLGSVCFAHLFLDQAPDYPTFSTFFPAAAREAAAAEALRALAKPAPSKSAIAVLDALELLDGDHVRTDRSKYAKGVMDLLTRKGVGQPLHRSEMLDEKGGVGTNVHARDRKFGLEPEWLVVLLSALVASGSISLVLPDRKYDTESVDALASAKVSDLAAFVRIEKQREWDVASIQGLAVLLGLSAEVGSAIVRGEVRAVTELQRAALAVRAKVETARSRCLSSGGGATRGEGGSRSDALAGPALQTKLTRIEELDRFLSTIAEFDAPPRFKRFPHDLEAIQAQRGAVDLLEKVDELESFLAANRSLLDDLESGAAIMPPIHTWRMSFEDARAALGKGLSELDAPGFRAYLESLGASLLVLRRTLAADYLALHWKARLGGPGEKRREALATDPRLANLKRMSVLAAIPVEPLIRLQGRLQELRACYNLTEERLQSAVLCPDCGFKPCDHDGEKPAGAVLVEIEETIEELDREWSARLFELLAAKATGAVLALLQDDQREEVETMLGTRHLPLDPSAALLRGLKQIFAGFENAVVLSSDELRAALRGPGTPSTLHEVRARLETFLAHATEGKDLEKLKIVIE